MLRGKKILEPVVLESYGRVCLAVEEIVMAGSMDPGDIDGLKDRIELKELSER